MGKFVLTTGLLALIASTGVSGVVSAQPVTQKSRITAKQCQPFDWPTYRKNLVAGPEVHVKVLQFLLRNQGFYKRQPDGKYDEFMATAVRNFQRAGKLKVDGIVGPQTWQPLVLRLKKGDRGDAVRALQTLLVMREPGLAVDGIFGAATDAAVRRFQEGLGDPGETPPVDGIAGPQTWSALLHGDGGRD